MDKFFFIALIVSPFLLFASWILTAKDKSTKKLLVVHSLIFILYILFVLNYSTLLIGHDEYGLGQIGLALTFIIIHIFVGFFYALYLNRKAKRQNKH